MRFFKAVSIAVIALITIFFISYSARITLINKFVHEQPSLYKLNVSCLDIGLESNMAIIIERLCLQGPKVDIEIVDAAIQWQYLPQINVTNIDVKHVNVRGTKHFFSAINHAPKTNQLNHIKQPSKLDFRQLLSTLSPYIKQIEKFTLPLAINLRDVSYLPFSAEKKTHVVKKLPLAQSTKAFSASLLAVADTTTLSLKNNEKVEIAEVKLRKNVQNNTANFSIGLSSQLQQLNDFINSHQLPISTQWQQALNASDISGRIDALVEYQAGRLNIKNQISDLIISSDQGIDKSGAFKLKGSFNFNTRLHLNVEQEDNHTDNKRLNRNKKRDNGNQKIALTFTGSSELSLEYNQQNFLSLLSEIQLSPEIISLVKDNPLKHLAVKLKEGSTISLSKQKLNVSNIEISANSDSRAHHLELQNIRLNLAQHSKNYKNNEQVDVQFVKVSAIDSFIVDSQLKVSSIAKFTTMPIVLHLEGSLLKNDEHTLLTLNKNSSVRAQNIVLKKHEGNAIAKVTKATKNKVLINLLALTTKLEGSVQKKGDNSPSLNLKADTQISQVNIANLLKLESLVLVSEVKGDLGDINMYTKSSADGVSLGNIIIEGATSSPKVNIVANRLLLTDLLSLDIQLPVDIKPIDGLLDFNIAGQLADLSAVDKSRFSGSIALTSFSGEVDGIWLQEVNWQQKFTLLEGKVSTIPNEDKNLTVELIETPAPISKLSINTQWQFNDSFKLSANKLNANVLGGSFSIPKIVWPFEHDHSVNVQLNSIDLEQVLALDKKQGIVVTGNISGELPITFDGEKYIIENGELYNISDGLIQVMDNPAVAELKASNTQLQLAFEALQNVHYHQLSSAVSMADDGYMLLETVIKGRNPDIDNDVNLNLNLSYDLLGLLESMSITQRFEESIIKGLQKTKE